MEKQFDYNIRLAVESDCYELSRLKLAIWNTTYRGIYPDEKFDNYSFEENEKKFIRIVNNPEVELYVVEHNNKLEHNNKVYCTGLLCRFGVNICPALEQYLEYLLKC